MFFLLLLTLSFIISFCFILVIAWKFFIKNNSYGFIKRFLAWFFLLFFLSFFFIKVNVVWTPEVTVMFVNFINYFLNIPDILYIHTLFKIIYRWNPDVFMYLLLRTFTAWFCYNNLEGYILFCFSSLPLTLQLCILLYIGYLFFILMYWFVNFLYVISYNFNHIFILAFYGILVKLYKDTEYITTHKKDSANNIVITLPLGVIIIFQTGTMINIYIGSLKNPKIKIDIPLPFNTSMTTQVEEAITLSMCTNIVLPTNTIINIQTKLITEPYLAPTTNSQTQTALVLQTTTTITLPKESKWGLPADDVLIIETKSTIII